LEGGISRANAAKLIATIAAPDGRAAGDRSDAVQEELEQARDTEVKAQLDTLDSLQQKARDHLDLKPDSLRDVVNLGLRLAGVPELIPQTDGTYQVPPFDTLPGVDGTWRDILDLLRAPPTKKVPVWKWRTESKPRPVSFEPSTSLTSKTVQIHLQHKLTQRALSPFRSQAFGEDKLARVTVVLDPTHSRKRVLALGRLSVYGRGASRLHEEVLLAAAFWSEGDGPGHLEPFKTSAADEKALESLYAALGRQAQGTVAPHVVAMLMANARRDEDALWEAVQSRATERRLEAEKQLQKRGEAEAAEMTRVLEAQRIALEKELHKRKEAEEEAKREALQVKMAWAVDEQEQKAQYESDTKHIEKRRVDLAIERDNEPQRIRDLYAVRHHRVERVGLVYLWPTTS
jgi:hypothetical protein